MMRMANGIGKIVRRAHCDQWSKIPSISLGSKSLCSVTTLAFNQGHTLNGSRSPGKLLIPNKFSHCRNASITSDSSSLRRTGLYDLHISKDGKMVPFGGYSMPVQYSDLSVGESHKWTREKASLFDVGHMVQHRLSGPGVTALLEKITPSSLTALQPSHSTLSFFLNNSGGIVDDTVITRLGPELFYLVTNAGCREKDSAYLSEQIRANEGNGAVHWEILRDWGLIALQGPLSADILSNALGGSDQAGMTDFYFGQCKHLFMNLPGCTTPANLFVTRSGYTGEDGFEISIPPEKVRPVVGHLLQSAGPDLLRLAGLGPRDSLRLEAGMCLYGHDLDDTTTPVEAGLAWVVHKDRRTAGGFHGDGVILRQLLPLKEGGGPSRRRVGLVVEGAPAREGAEIVATSAMGAAEGIKIIGKVTSGCPSPTLGKNIAMGYVESGHHKVGTELGVIVRGKRRKGEVVRMPFVPSRYNKQPAAGTALA